MLEKFKDRYIFDSRLICKIQNKYLITFRYITSNILIFLTFLKFFECILFNFYSKIL